MKTVMLPTLTTKDFSYLCYCAYWAQPLAVWEGLITGMTSVTFGQQRVNGDPCMQILFQLIP